MVVELRIRTGTLAYKKCARCLLNAVNGNVVDAIDGIHKTVLCSSLRMFVCATLLLLLLPCKSIFKRKPKIGRIQRSQVDPHLMSNQCNRMQNEIGYVVDVTSFVCSFLSSGS